MSGAYATDANTRLLTAVLGNSLQTSSAQRRREFGTLVMDIYVRRRQYIVTSESIDNAIQRIMATSL
jgi:hypothetical protein